MIVPAGVEFALATACATQIAMLALIFHLARRAPAGRPSQQGEELNMPVSAKVQAALDAVNAAAQTAVNNAVAGLTAEAEQDDDDTAAALTAAATTIAAMEPQAPAPATSGT